jgi:hypothetical protein
MILSNTSINHVGDKLGENTVNTVWDSFTRSIYSLIDRARMQLFNHIWSRLYVNMKKRV